MVDPKIGPGGEVEAVVDYFPIKIKAVPRGPFGLVEDVCLVGFLKNKLVVEPPISEAKPLVHNELRDVQRGAELFGELGFVEKNKIIGELILPGDRKTEPRHCP